MASETDRIPNIVVEVVVNAGKTHSAGESDVPVASSSSNEAVVKMVNKTTPVLSDYWKKSMVTKADCSAYHTAGWLGSALESFVPTVEVPMVDNSTIVCFESHLITGLGLPPSKFLVSILNFLGCEMVHLNANVIAALSCFTMLCECRLGIAPDTSLFLYLYSLARYNKTVYSRIGLSLRHNCREGYLDATFKGSWRGASQRWFLVDIHVPPQWANKHLLPPLIDNKRGEPKMTLRLAALVKRVGELPDAGLRACHYVE
jgi:hypothetical protein